MNGTHDALLRRSQHRSTNGSMLCLREARNSRSKLVIHVGETGCEPGGCTFWSARCDWLTSHFRLTPRLNRISRCRERNYGNRVKCTEKERRETHVCVCVCVCRLCAKSMRYWNIHRSTRGGRGGCICVSRSVKAFVPASTRYLRPWVTVILPRRAPPFVATRRVAFFSIADGSIDLTVQPRVCPRRSTSTGESEGSFATRPTASHWACTRRRDADQARWRRPARSADSSDHLNARPVRPFAPLWPASDPPRKCGGIFESTHQVALHRRGRKLLRCYVRTIDSNTSRIATYFVSTKLILSSVELVFVLIRICILIDWFSWMKVEFNFTFGFVKYCRLWTCMHSWYLHLYFTRT